MYRIYKTEKGKLIFPKKPVKDCWIELSFPTESDLNELKPFFEIPEEVLIAVKDVNEVPKVEMEDKFEFILIQTPIDKKDSGPGEYIVSPLGILYNNDYVITICDSKNDVILYVSQKLKNFNNNQLINTDKRHQLILKLMLFASKIYLRNLKIINQNIQKTQDELEKDPENEEITKLMDIGKSLAYFNRSLRSNNIVAQKLSKRKKFNQTEEDEELIEDVLDETKQGVETVKIYERIVVDTANTFSTIISNNLNKTVKTLTSITIILMIPTLVASIYGMNVELPYQDIPSAFIIIIGILIVSSILGVLFFYKNKLF